jgi:hypothetical protein
MRLRPRWPAISDVANGAPVNRRQRQQPPLDQPFMKCVTDYQNGTSYANAILELLKGLFFGQTRTAARGANAAKG